MLLGSVDFMIEKYSNHTIYNALGCYLKV